MALILVSKSAMALSVAGSLTALAAAAVCSFRPRIRRTALLASVTLAETAVASAKRAWRSAAVVAFTRGSGWMVKLCVFVDAIGRQPHLVGAGQGGDAAAAAGPHDHVGEDRILRVAHVPDEAVEPGGQRRGRRALGLVVVIIVVAAARRFGLGGLQAAGKALHHRAIGGDDFEAE